jgi:lipoprotein-anchoring transpeptidase ErfK/SrfK
MRVEVTLAKNRMQVGKLQAYDDAGQPVLGPVNCLGRADAGDAKLHGNPERNSLRPFGDTPTGYYNVVRMVSHHGSESDIHTYGTYPALLLDPVSGDALKAKQNSRSGLMIHGGAPSMSGKLRPTHGCIRLSENDQRDLVALVVGSALAASTVVVTEI